MKKINTLKKKRDAEFERKRAKEHSLFLLKVLFSSVPNKKDTKHYTLNEFFFLAFLVDCFDVVIAILYGFHLTRFVGLRGNLNLFLLKRH